MKDGKVGILGSGDVARSLGRGFANHGYLVKLGSRAPTRLEPWTAEVGRGSSAGSLAEAAAFAPLVIVATRGSATEEAVALAGPTHFAGKLVLDATNPLDHAPGVPPGLLFGTTDSLGERLQRRLPDARVVKCFNTVAHAMMVDPPFRSGPARMWICGNDAGAKRATEEILRELGWAGALDLGGIEAARWLEAMVPLWVRTGLALNTWGHFLQPVV